MEKLTISSLKIALASLGESSAGAKNDLLCRLEEVMRERKLTVDKVLELVRTGRRVEMSDQNEDGVIQEVKCTEVMVKNNSVNVGEQVGANDDIRPEDSVSQVGAVAKKVKQKGVGSHVSMVSRTSTCMTSLSALERRRVEVRRKVEAAQNDKLEQLERLKRQSQKERLEKEKLRRDEELKEKLRELELEEEIMALEREARDDALRVEAEAWGRYARVDLGEVQNFQSTPKQIIEESNLWRQDRQYLEIQQLKEAENNNNANSSKKENGKLDGQGVGGENLSEKKDNIMLRELTANSLRMCLPKHEIEVFSGEASEYTIFKQSMQSIMNSKTIDEGEKLHYIYQYTRGEPRELVKAALYMDSRRGLTEIWKWYNEKYGAPELVGSEFIDKLLSRPTVGRDDVEALRAFAVSLRLTGNVVDQVPSGKSELEHPKTIRLLISKLSFGLQDRWRQLVSRKREEGGQIVYMDLVRFVEQAARTDSDPIFGKEVMHKLFVGTSTVNSRNRKVIPINVVSFGNDHFESGQVEKDNHFSNTKRDGELNFSPKCYQCGDSHKIESCRYFKGLQVNNRFDLVKKRRACFICLVEGHSANNCPRPKICNKCDRYHHEMLHVDRSLSGTDWSSFTPSFGNTSRRIQNGSNRNDPKFSNGGELNEIGSDRVFNSNSEQGNRVPIGRVSIREGTDIGAMAVLPAVIRSNSNSISHISVFLDQGSAVSFCTSRLLDKLNISKGDIHEAFLHAETLHASKREKTYLVSGLTVKGENEEEWIPLPPVYVVNKIPINKKDVIDRSEIARWDHLQGIELNVVRDVDLMLGSNVPAAHGPIEIRVAPRSGDPYAIRSLLGWSVIGLIAGQSSSNVPVNKVRINTEEIKRLVECAFERGFEGLVEDKEGFSGEDEHWLKLVEDGCHSVNTHYEIPLPMREHSSDLPDTRSSAYRRVMGLKKKLEKDPELRKQYEGGMEDLIRKGYVEKVECSNSKGKWYIPHFAVKHPAKPDKVRIVFDCAAKSNGLSLNDLLYSGPDLATQLIDVLLRFREGCVAYTADIEAMFHQVLVPEKHRKYLRFFWWDGGIEGGQIHEFQMAVHPFGASSSPSIANYALRKLGDDMHDTFNKSVRNILTDNFYVDDCLRSGSSLSLMRTEALKIKNLCSMGGFNLCKYVSNVDEIQRDLAGDVDAEKSCQKALGVVWNVASDSLGVVNATRETPATKRKLLSSIAGVYDPLGLLAPLVLQGRILFQDVIREDGVLEWDGKLNESHEERAKTWILSMHFIQQTNVPRNVIGRFDTVSCLQLHIFGDACERGHAAVAYVRVEQFNGEVDCTFVMGNARVNPLKSVTVPRLELVAATLVSRMCHRLKKTLKTSFDKTFLWTDSMTVLRYLRNDKLRYQTFVANRVSEIKRKTNLHEWRYVNTGSNPADEGSRGQFTERWKKGSSFLLNRESEWPIEEKAADFNSTEDLEVKRDVPVLALAIGCSPMITLFERYSEWRALIRAVGWLQKFIRFVSNKKKLDPDSKGLTVGETEKAERCILKIVQGERFSSEYECLTKGMSVRKGSVLSNLGVFLNNDLIRVGGRLSNSELPYNSRHPIVLPDHHVTTLIIRDCHARAGHLGVSTVLGWTREMFWIIRGYSTVRRVISKCVLCKKVQGKSLQQKMACLPEERVADHVPAFTFTGLDCFGPFYVSVGRGKTQVKRYGVIFTCMNVRAVHLEIAQDLSSEAILRAIRRFMSRRGMVRLFCSDNGTNFVGAKRELLESLGNARVLYGVGKMDVRWEFNTPKASHFGGIWERVIRTVRRVLESVMGRKTFTDDSLQTVFCEVEAIVNSRPLIIVGDDPSEGVLNPQKLLNLGTSMIFEGNVPKTVPDVCKRYEHIQAIADQFWKRWCRDYRSSLQGRAKWVEQKRNVKIGDIVLMIDETQPRCHWPVGRVMNVKTSSDGLVRSLTLNSKGRTYVRPISKLIMLIENEELP